MVDGVAPGRPIVRSAPAGEYAPKRVGTGLGEDTVIIGAGGNPAVAKSGSKPVPVKALDEDSEISELLMKLFYQSTVTSDFRQFISDGFTASADGSFHLQDKKGELKAFLEKFTGIPSGDITDEALDYLFGNQDGKLDKGDIIANKRVLIDRLKFLVPYFVTMQQSGGVNAYQTLRIDNIVAVDKMPTETGINLQGLADSKDRVFLTALEAALDGYQRDETIPEDEKQDFIMKWRMRDPKAPIDVSTLPRQVIRLLHVALLNNFDNTCRTNKVKYPIAKILSDEKYREAFFKGAYADFVEGHADPKNPDAITHNLPKDFDIETLNALARKRAEANAKRMAGVKPVPEAGAQTPAVAPGKTDPK